MQRGYDGFTDNLMTLESLDDVATMVVGNGARMPTSGDWQELIENTKQKWTTQNGVKGCLFKGSNGKGIFLPATGSFSSELEYVGTYGNYWSSSLGNDPINAWACMIRKSNMLLRESRVSDAERSMGLSVRAVCAGQN